MTQYWLFEDSYAEQFCTTDSAQEEVWHFGSSGPEINKPSQPMKSGDFIALKTSHWSDAEPGPGIKVLRVGYIKNNPKNFQHAPGPADAEIHIFWLRPHFNMVFQNLTDYEDDFYGPHSVNEDWVQQILPHITTTI